MARLDGAETAATSRKLTNAGRLVMETLYEGLVLAVAGGAAGLAAAAAAVQLLRAQLYGVDPLDPISYGAAVLLILTGASIACCVPARLATGGSPMDALRAD